MRGLFRLFAVLAFLLGAEVSAQTIMEKLITPGPLSTPHARFEPTCNACHVNFSREAQNAKCLTCHKGIASDVSAGAGFHGKFGNARAQPCKVCHSDHKGRGFSLIRFTRTGVNHALTDYALAGGHAKAACAGCHQPGNHYRGTPTTCATCHAKKDPHLGRLGRACQTCHSVTAWKQILPFDHTKTDFPLAGQHRTAACLTCHVGQRWNGTPQQCIACHAKNDVHKGTRGTNCASCHAPSAWKSVSFDHNADTSFPLRGAHASTACAGCHGAGNTIRKPAKTCFSCHAKDDSHKGSRGTNCAECHSAVGWKSVSFDHNKDTSFPLLGSHAATKCAACHGVGNTVPKPAKTCFACHEKDDTHKGSNGTDCAQCHDAKSWKQANFDHNKMTRFALVGAHVKVECGGCHKLPPKAAKPPLACIGCHAAQNPHDKSFSTDCASCHNAVGWKDKVAFDHSLTRFPLLGKHAPLLCTACHADKSFTSKGITCQSCHTDDHHVGTLGQPSGCARCHNANGWKMWRFDHDAETSFALTGRHKGLICSACHARPGDPAKLPSACIDCHRHNDVHNGNFGENCARCHVTSSFAEIIM
jgi:Cytochrome c7 and related cytochrome c